MRSLHRFAIRHPAATFLVALLALAAAAPGMVRLRLRTDGHALVPPRDPQVVTARAIRADFDIEDQIAVVIRSRDQERGVFNTGTLALVKELATRIAALSEIDPSEVMSLATERSDQVFTGTVEPRPFLEPLPRTPADLERLRDDLRAIRLYSGTLVSRDERSTAIIVGVPNGADRAALHARLLERIAALQPMEEDVLIVGAPIAESLLGTHLLEDLGVPSTLLGRTGEQEDAAAGHSLESWRDLPRWIGQRVGLVPIALLIMAAVFLVSFRSPLAAAIPLVEVGACLLMVFGLMGWSGVPVYLTIAVMPVILTAVGVTDEIHIFSRYRQLAVASPGAAPREIALATMEQMGPPVVKTSLTTAVGFVSFAFSPIAAVRAFGVFTAVGVIICMIWSLTLVPAMLSVIPVRSLVGHGGATLGFAAGFGRLAVWAARRRRAVVAAVGLLVALVPLGLWRVRVQDSWIDGFASHSPFRAATEMVNREFLGTHILMVQVDAGGSEIGGEVEADSVEFFRLRVERGDIATDPEHLVGQWVQVYAPGAPNLGVASEARTRHHSAPALIESVAAEGAELVLNTVTHFGSLRIEPWPQGTTHVAYRIEPRRLLDRDTLQSVCDLESLLERQQELAVGGVLGPCDYLETTEFIVRQRRDEADRVVPVKTERLHYLWQRYAHGRGVHRLREVIDPSHSRALITVYMTGANFRDTGRLMDMVRRHEAEHLAPRGLSVAFSGDVAESQALIRAIVTTQVQSLVFSLLGIVAVTAILGRSLRWGLLCTVPCVLAVMINFAVMGALSIPLGVATSMFSAMTLGIGVDAAIHLTERYRAAAAHGALPVQALGWAARVTGPALLVDAAAIVLGFGVLTLSQVPANARLGGLVVLSMATSFIVTLVLVPALVAWWRPGVSRS